MRTGAPCAQCGARYDDAEATCATRFDELLALDHSRREPWGSRHGLAFSTFALQHPASYDDTVLDRAWVMLHRIVVRGDDLVKVFAAIAGKSVDTSTWNAPPRPSRIVRHPSITIADLGDFDAVDYAERVEAWARATVEAWGGV